MRGHPVECAPARRKALVKLLRCAADLRRGCCTDREAAALQMGKGFASALFDLLGSRRRLVAACRRVDEAKQALGLPGGHGVGACPVLCAQIKRGLPGQSTLPEYVVELGGIARLKKHVVVAEVKAVSDAVNRKGECRQRPW